MNTVLQVHGNKFFPRIVDNKKQNDLSTINNSYGIEKPILPEKFREIPAR